MTEQMTPDALCAPQTHETPATYAVTRVAPLTYRSNAAGCWVEDAEGRLRLNLPGASAEEREAVQRIVEGICTTS